MLRIGNALYNPADIKCIRREGDNIIVEMGDQVRCHTFESSDLNQVWEKINDEMTQPSQVEEFFRYANTLARDVIRVTISPREDDEYQSKRRRRD